MLALKAELVGFGFSGCKCWNDGLGDWYVDVHVYFLIITDGSIFQNKSSVCGGVTFLVRDLI